MAVKLDYRDLFFHMHPGFFEKENIRALPAGKVYEEMTLELSGFSESAMDISVPEGIVFKLYDGSLEKLRQDVARVDEGWVELYGPKDRVYCAMDGDKIASFCMLEDMTRYGGLKIGGPGCVGTVPEYRKRGIGLKMIQNATGILKNEGFDLSYIHFTGVAPWYAKLGYRTVLRWNREGILT